MDAKKMILLGRIGTNSRGGFASCGVMLGGILNSGASAGLFYFNANYSPSGTNWNFGASHSYGISDSEQMFLPLLSTKVGKSADESTGQ